MRNIIQKSIYLMAALHFITACGSGPGTASQVADVKVVESITPQSVSATRRIAVFTNTSGLYAVQFKVSGIRFGEASSGVVSTGSTITAVNANSYPATIGIMSSFQLEANQPIVVLEGEVIGDIVTESVIMADRAADYVAVRPLIFKLLD